MDPEPILGKLGVRWENTWVEMPDHCIIFIKVIRGCFSIRQLEGDGRNF